MATFMDTKHRTEDVKRTLFITIEFLEKQIELVLHYEFVPVCPREYSHLCLLPFALSLGNM